MGTKLIATPPSNSLPPDYSRVETFSAPDAGFLIAVSIVILSAIATSIYAFLPKQAQERSFNLKPPYKTPCQHCRYFSCNPYLKCTVHPFTVLTEQAVDCLDYSPNTVKERTKGN